MTPAEQVAERQAAALERIAAVLEAMHEHLRQAPDVVECQHPEEERTDLGSTMGHERWRCKLCGYEVQS